MNNRLYSCLIALLLTFAGATDGHAIPAWPGWMTMTQPDGSTVRIRIMGDEHCHWIINSDSVEVEERDGFYVPATTKHTAKRRAAYSPALRTPIGGFSDGFTGKRRALIILAEFKDKFFHSGEPDTQGYFSRMANEEGFSDNGAAGSVRDYFLQQSYGQFDLTFDVVGPVRLSGGVNYYGGGNRTEIGYAGRMVAEACRAVDAQYPDIDFSNYDWDGDGYVEQVFIIYAGYGQATGGGENTIWPHRALLSDIAKGDRTYNYNVTLDGVRVDQYACSNEYWGNYGRQPMGLGTICHEFSHCLGLPDIYDVDYDSSYDMGSWDVMASGCYNGGSWVPAGFNAVEKMLVGWLKPTELWGESLHVDSMRPLTRAGDAYIVYNPTDRNEFFTVESRKQEGFDASLPSSGMLALHVYHDINRWAKNRVNTTREGSQTFVTLPADGIRSAATEATDTYPNGDMDSLTYLGKLTHPLADGSTSLRHRFLHIAKDSTGNISFDYVPSQRTLTAITTLRNGESHNPEAIYNLSGQKVGTMVTATDKPALPRGIYIWNGKTIRWE